MAQKSEFGMHHLHITAGHNYWSHEGTKINDIAGSDGGIDYFYPPFDCEVKEIENKGTGNSVVFQSIGKVYIPKFDSPVNVCFRCTHANGLIFKDSNNEELHDKSIFFKDGDKYCYLEGMSGNAEGNHIHIEFALGTYKETQMNNVPCRYMITNEADSQLFLHEAVFIKPGTTVVKNDPNESYYVNQYAFTLSTGEKRTVWYWAVNGTGTPPIDPEPPVVQRGVKMVLTGSAARLRADMPSGTIVTTIPNGSTFDVVGLYSWNATDGYKWGWGEYNGKAGYFQYDPKVMHPIGTSLDGKYKMILENSAAYLRDAIQGNKLTLIAKGSTLVIREFMSNRGTDGYYWCRTLYNGSSAYFQYDPTVMYPTND